MNTKHSPTCPPVVTAPVPAYVTHSMRDWRAAAERARFYLSAVRGRLAVASLGCEAATISAMRQDAARCDQVLDLLVHGIGCHLDGEDCIEATGEPCGRCPACAERQAEAVDRAVDAERDRRMLAGLDT